MIRGITFASQRTFSKDFAHFQNTLLGTSGITKGCDITETEGSIKVCAGYFFACGHEVAIEGEEIIPVPDRYGSDLYCKVVFEIDLSKMNTISSFNQGYFKTLISADGYPDETREDLDAGGSIYQLPFATYILASTGVTKFVDVRPILSVSEVWKKMEQYTKRLVNGQQITDSVTGKMYTIGVNNGVLYYTNEEQNSFSFQLSEECTNKTVFNSNGSITQTFNDGRKKNTVLNSDGSVTETSYFNGIVSYAKTTKRNSDGSITEVIS